MIPSSAPTAAAPAVRWRRVLLAATLGTLGVCLLAGLGIWQLERRAWKLDLIQKVRTRQEAPPHCLPRDALDNPAAHDYERVQLTGTYLQAHDTWVHATTELGAGYWVLTPLKTQDGTVILVNRGFVPLDTPRSSISPPPSGGVTGVLRLSESQSLWPRLNQPGQDRWYSRDVDAIALARGLSAVARFFVDADARMEDGAAPAAAPVRPVGGLTVVHFRNAHLSYALTWFALALMTAIAATHVLRAELRGYDRAG